MNRKTIALAGIAGFIAILAVVVAYPTMAATQTGASQSQTQLLMNGQASHSLSKVSFTQGETVTFTSTAGGYIVIGDRDVNGTASGTLTIQVNGVLKGGYVVTVTGGSINLGGTAFTISGGSAEIGSYGRNVVGQGTASNSTFFLFHERSIGSFGGTPYGVLTFDLSNGSTEYGVRLLVTTATA